MTGIFIIARLGSTRLSQKHLIPVQGQSFIEWLTSRFSSAFRKEIDKGETKIFIVTSERAENRTFENLFSNNKDIHIFYGSDSNIPLRQLQCAQANGITKIISIDGDDVLCSTRAAMLVGKCLNEGSVYCKTSGLPLGMNAFGYTKSFLEQAMAANSIETLETGWGKIFNEEVLKDQRLGNYDKDERLRMTLDYEEDARFFSAVIEGLKNRILDIADEEMIEYIIGNKLYEINQGVQDKYWKNFDLQKNAEI